MPITNADMVNVQSRFENRKSVWTTKDNNNATMTTMICAVSIPSAKSKSGSNLSVAFPASMDLK